MSYEARIKIGFEESKKLLECSKINFTENYVKKICFSKTNLSQEFINHCFDKDYSNLYSIARKNHDYDILLDDQSIIQFTYEKENTTITHIRYAYFESPKIIVPYEEFLEMMELDYEECGDAFFEEYEQFRNEAQSKSVVNPIRYDYDRGQYRGLIHPTSHFHIGHDNEIRIPAAMMVSPLGFTSFIIRQVYYRRWEESLKDQRFYDAYLKLKTHCLVLDEELFSKLEQTDFFLG